MKRPKWRWAMLAAVALSGVLVAPASGHPVEERRTAEYYRAPGFCVLGTVSQEHAWHYTNTSASICQAPAMRTNHIHYQEYYKTRVWGAPGELCWSEGWHEAFGAHVHHHFYGWDVGHMCNYGGVNVWVSIDSWQFSARPNVGYLGGARRPATKHCHCP